MPFFVAGAVLPDLLSRLPPALLSAADGRLVPVPTALIHFWTPLHLPCGIALWCLLLCFMVPESLRRRALLNLLGGGALHVLLDLFQWHATPTYLLAYPFSSQAFELGLVGTEASVRFAPLLALVTWLVWRWFGPRDEQGPGEPTRGEAEAPAD